MGAYVLYFSSLLLISATIPSLFPSTGQATFGEVFLGFGVPSLLVVSLTVFAAFRFWRKHLKSVTLGLCGAAAIPVAYYGYCLIVMACF